MGGLVGQRAVKRYVRVRASVRRSGAGCWIVCVRKPQVSVRKPQTPPLLFSSQCAERVRREVSLPPMNRTYRLLYAHSKSDLLHELGVQTPFHR